MLRIEPAMQAYAWGDEHSIPALLGRPAPGGPVAEAWWGAHPAAPTTVVGGGTLLDAIAGDPQGALGARVKEGRLPYLLKVLAIAQPISLQVHPNAEQARAGFDREEAAGIPLDDPTRIYRDRHDKPEIIVAITEMVLLSGFREPSDLIADLAALSHNEDAVALARALSDGGLDAYVRTALARLADPTAIAAAVRAEGAAPGTSASMRAAGAAAAQYPDDGGVMVALALNAVTLAPGEACFTPDGVVHSYQSGVGLEVMANSDNVIRAGLTPKHVDVPELLAVASTRPSAPVIVAADRDGAVARYRVDTPDFAIAMVTDGAAGFPGGPRIVIAHAGTAELTSSQGASLELARGEAAFVPASDGAVTVAATGAVAVVSAP